MFLQKVRRWGIGLGGLVLLGLVVTGYLYYRHLDLLYENNGAIIYLGRKPVLGIGREIKSVVPLAIADSFGLIETTDGRRLKTPKYENNALFQNEFDGVVYASDIDTGELDVYQWSKNTAYTCGTKESMAPPAYLNLEVDPKRDLENYLFVLRGDSWEGRQGEQGLAMFRQDVSSGDPVKLYTTSADNNVSGRKELAVVVLFTSHSECVKTEVSEGEQ